jgi:N-acetyl-anhydromuramyl-L-alanine amidase AmpD
MQSKYVLKIGQNGDLVRILQELLCIRADGEFGNKTHTSVIQFQKDNSLIPDGIVGPMTWKRLDYNPLELEADSDHTTSATWIQQYRLPDGEYVKQETNKEWIFLHHTAGRSNPKKTIDHWASDQRGRVGTHYVIGGVQSTLDLNNLSEEDSKHNGKILQAIGDEYWAYHLGPVKSSKMHRGSISIEICSAGYLTQTDNKFYTWYGAEVHASQVCRLETSYKDHKYYHKYSHAQIKSLKALLLLLADKHAIDLKSGISDLIRKSTSNEAFNYNETANLGKIKGILTHGQVRTGKSDVFPQKELIDMLVGL